MPEKTTDLWPDDFGDEKIRPPIAIMREQAVALGERTSQLIQARVSTGTGNLADLNIFGGSIKNKPKEILRHRFIILVPSMDNYRYSLFRAEHDVQPYPVAVMFTEEEGEEEATYIGDDAEKFEDLLRMIFGSERTRRIVGGLLSQAQAF